MQAEGLLASCYYGYLFHDCRAYRADWGPDNQARQSVTWPRLLQKGLGGNGPRSVVPRWPAVPGQALPRLVNTTRLRPELLRAGEPSAPHVSGHHSPTPHAARTSELNELRSAVSMTRLALAHPSFPGVLQREDPSSWESGPRDQRTGSPTSDSVTSSMPILYKTGTTNADSQDVRKQAQCPAYEWASMGPGGCHPDTQAHTQHKGTAQKCPNAHTQGRVALNLDLPDGAVCTSENIPGSGAPSKLKGEAQIYHGHVPPTPRHLPPPPGPLHSGGRVSSWPCPAVEARPILHLWPQPHPLSGWGM